MAAQEPLCLGLRLDPVAAVVEEPAMDLAVKVVILEAVAAADYMAAVAAQAA